ncbi:MAG TPA: SusC/RagA family TonB-linked outer membrane protein, partial [Flavobacteriaceae bacterium]|nr:SusC/RagA family TonB-linked outer membrane protein [Flavobacteriaceae bacterium]
MGLFCATPLLAQKGKTVTGTVKELQVPLVGVMVKEEGTDNSTFTDSNGNYSLTLQQDNAKLIFEQLDFPIREEEVLNRSVINVRFTKVEEGIQLKDVVINAGYYNVKDKERTGSIARVTAKEIENQPVNNVLDALQGRVAGLEITPTTGTAGGGYTIRLRGQNSINAGNDPLFIIDGVPYNMNSLSDLVSSNNVLPKANINPLNSISPDSIESIEVLKDADATAIYGSRGANGVILITTKKGKAGKVNLIVDTSSSLMKMIKKMPLLSTEQYVYMRKKAYQNDGITSYPANAYDINGTWDQNRYTDWQKVLLGKTATNYSTSATLSGGSEQTRFIIGTLLTKETSVFYGDYQYNKSSFFTSISHQSPNEKFNLSFTAQYGLDQNKLPTQDLTTKARTLAPNAPRLFNDDGSLNWENNTWVNPLAALNATYRNKTTALNTNLLMKYKLFGNTFLQSNFGYNTYELEDLQLNPNTIRNPAFGIGSDQSGFIRNNAKRNSWLIEPQLSSSFQLSDVMKFEFLAGVTFNHNESDKIVVQASGFTDNRLMPLLSAAKSVTILSDLADEYRYNAVYGRLNMNVKGKYILNLTGRRDGSSRFGPDNRFANFGAIGAAWIFSKEHFLSNQSWLSFGKLRGSYGVTGNDQIGDYQYLNTYSITQGGYNGNVLLTPSRLYNPTFSWEKNKKLELALEVELFRNRLGVELTYYQNRSDNQLIAYSLPTTTGFTSIQANLDALVENRGLELNVNTKNIQTANFRWTTSFNLTLPQNKLLRFDNIKNTPYANQYVIGESLGIKKMYHYLGVNPTTGIYEFEDYNQDGKLTALNDRSYIVDLNPKFYGGLNNSIAYKQWQLDLFMQFVKKKGYNEKAAITMPGLAANVPVSVFNSWEKSGDHVDSQRFSSGMNAAAIIAFDYYTSSDAVISDLSFIRLKTLSISYKLTAEKLHIPETTIYIQGHNLWKIGRAS